MRILFTGGGTAGSLAPLIAVAEVFRLQEPTTDILFLTSKNPADRAFVERFGFHVQTFSSGKWRRYFSLRNVLDLFTTTYALFRAWFFLGAWKPDVVVSAGSYLSIPVALAARRRGIPVAIHQQDVQRGLANKTMTRAASLITVAFERSVGDFPQQKRIVWTGNPVRPDLLNGDRERGRKHFHVEAGVPVLLIFGGSSGARRLNELTTTARDALTRFCHVVHVYGRNGDATPSTTRYTAVPFLADELADAYAAADLVLCRAGLSTITELAALGKASVVVPMPDTHQEHNALLLRERAAALVADERTLTPDLLVTMVRELLLEDGQRRSALGASIRTLTRDHAAERVHAEILTIIRRP